MNYYIKTIVLLFLSVCLIESCVDNDDLVEYGDQNITRNDEFSDLLVNTPKISFVAGVADYAIEFLVITPGSDDVTSVNVFKIFTDAATSAVSDPVILKSYNIDPGNTALVNDKVTFGDLREGITINGSPLTDDELAIPIGSSWTLSLQPVNSSNEEVFSNSNEISIAVLSPFAGFYTVLESAYFRIGVESGLSDWSGQSRFIGSVDANTFAYIDNWGPFGPLDGAVGQFVFDLNDDNSISVLDDQSQLFFSGDEMLTCQNDIAEFANVSCAGSNVLEPAADGKHIIRLTYGYASGGGAREFTEVLEKIVD